MKSTLVLLWYCAFLASTAVARSLNNNNNKHIDVRMTAQAGPRSSTAIRGRNVTGGIQRHEFDALVFVKQLKVGGSTIAGVVRQLMWLRSVLTHCMYMCQAAHA